MNLSIIVASQGRESLIKTLESITPQMLPGDELLVKMDASNDWGATPRTKAMGQARGDYLLFMDDDDVYKPGAFAAVRAAIVEEPWRPLMFGMFRHHHEPATEAVLPRSFELIEGNISTQMFVLPNNPSRLGVWGTRYEGDFDFIVSTLAFYPPGSLVWRPEVISEWRASR